MAEQNYNISTAVLGTLDDGWETGSRATSEAASSLSELNSNKRTKKIVFDYKRYDWMELASLDSRVDQVLPGRKK